MKEEEQKVEKKGHITPTVPEPTPPKELLEPTKNKVTLDTRIDELIKSCEDEGHGGTINTSELKVGIKDMIQRVTFPHEFCPSCDDKMFYQQDKRSYRCINCGYDTQNVTQEKQPPVQQGAQVPAAVSSAIKQAGQVNQDRRSIPQLRAKKPVSQEDDAAVRQDPNVKGDINWV